jgi:inhibitor of cysteine peptidase
MPQNRLARRFRLLTLLALPLAGCSTIAAESPPLLRVGEAQAGASLDLARSQPIAVSLPANPSTGYSWALAAQPPETVLKLQGPSTYVPDPAAAGLAGAGGLETWSFIAVGAGQGDLRFEYRRPWERDVPPAKTVVYRLRIR